MPKSKNKNHIKYYMKNNLNLKKIKLNSKDIKPGDIFIPFPNRYQYIPDAINKNCKLVISDKYYKNKKVLKINNLNQEIINIFNKYYNYPLKKINLIGITGTEGKTTITSILSDLLNIPSIGTNGFIINNKTYNLNNTTPSLDILYKAFNLTKNKHYKHLVMEVSSEAFLTNRIGNLPFKIGILTDIKKDHLDKHKTFNNYLNCKLQLFKQSNISILNTDLKYYKLFKQASKKTYSYGFSKKANLRIINYKLYKDKTIIKLKYKNKIYKIKSPLLGKFNVYNLTASFLTLLVLGFKPPVIIKKIKNINQVKGRMEIISLKPFIVLDYAHTTNATFQVLNYFKKFNKNIITIVGCAGNRYKEKRKEIGSIVLKYSKLVIFTMDDPRDEDPKEIIKEMLNNTNNKNYIIIINREKAIKYGIKNYSNDLILILGKGRDNYMAIKNKKISYSDYQVINKILYLTKE